MLGQDRYIVTLQKRIQAVNDRPQVLDFTECLTAWQGALGVGSWRFSDHQISVWRLHVVRTSGIDEYIAYGYSKKGMSVKRKDTNSCSVYRARWQFDSQLPLIDLW